MEERNSVGKGSMNSEINGKVVSSNYKVISAVPGHQLGYESANVALNMTKERLEPKHLARVIALQEQQEVESEFDG